MAFDMALWRGLDKAFVEDIANLLETTSFNPDLATVTISTGREPTTFLFSIHDGNVEHFVLTQVGSVNVHRRIDGLLVGRDATLTDFRAERIRGACQALFDRLKTRGGFQVLQEATH